VHLSVSGIVKSSRTLRSSFRACNVDIYMYLSQWDVKACPLLYQRPGWGRRRSHPYFVDIRRKADQLHDQNPVLGRLYSAAGGVYDRNWYPNFKIPIFSYDVMTSSLLYCFTITTFSHNLCIITATSHDHSAFSLVTIISLYFIFR